MQPGNEHKKILALISQDVALPSPPAIALQLLTAVQSDVDSLATIADIIARDPALSAKVLKVANSGVFGCCSQVSNISRATSILGTHLVKNIALSFILTKELKDRSQAAFDYDLFWRRSLTIAVSAELLAKAVQHHSGDMYVAGLLQDVGTVVIFRSKGHHYTDLVQSAQDNSSDLRTAEKETYGYNHPEVSYALFSSWNLPLSISEPILYHHQPESAPAECRVAANILYFADLISDIYFQSHIASKVRQLQAGLMETFNLEEAGCLELLDEVADKAFQMMAGLELSPAEMKPYSQILQEANTELANLNLSNMQLALEIKEANSQAENLARELKDAKSRLQELKYRDGMTGLYNHRYFLEALDNELTRADRYHASLSLVFIDVDYFQKVNEEYGYPAGDQVLRNITEQLSDIIRPHDILCRYSNGCLGLIIPKSSKPGTKIMASRLRLSVEGMATPLHGRKIYVTISIGAACKDPQLPSPPAEQLIEVATRALENSKQNGRNQVTVVEIEEPVN